MPTLRVGEEENIGENILILICFVQYSSTYSFIYVPFIINDFNNALHPLTSTKIIKLRTNLILITTTIRSLYCSFIFYHLAMKYCVNEEFKGSISLYVTQSTKRRIACRCNSSSHIHPL